MNPSEAKVFSSGISGFISSKKRKDFAYSRLDQTDNDSVEFSNVHFQKDHTPLCTKLFFGLLALMLLFATVATTVFLMNWKHFTVDLRLEEGNVRVYKFDQQVKINGNEATTTNMSIVVSMHVINRTEDDCWFGVVLNLPKESKTYSHSKDFTFLTHVSNAELVDFQDGPENHFKVFGNHLDTNQELSFYVYNVLNQLLPIIKVKLYEFVLSKLSSSSSNFAVTKNVFLPGRVHLKRTIMTKRDTVIVTTRAEPGDFESFSADEKGRSTSWRLSYDETTVVDKRTGMVDRGDMSVSAYLPISSDFTSGRKRKPIHGLEVSFRSTVESVDESEAEGKNWREILENEKDFNQLLTLPSVKESVLLYFAPPKGNPRKKPSEVIKELIKLSRNSQGRSTKLPPMIKIEQYSTVNADESDGAENDYQNDDDDEEFSDNSVETDDDDDDSENDNDDDENVPYWPQPNYAPYGIGYEVKRKRSVTARRSQIIKKAARKSRKEQKTPELDEIWDEITSSAPAPTREPPRVIHSSIFGFDFLAEIDYNVKANDENDSDNDDDSDNDNDEDWSVTTSYQIALKQYRISAFSKVHTLSALRSKLPREGQQKTSRWTVDAGDFVSQKTKSNFN